jgi:hypothetical protein
MASPFASHPSNQRVLEVPADPGQTVTIRKLTGLEVDAAQEAHLKGIVAGKSARGWSAAFQRVLNKSVSATDEDARAVLADPLTGYDRITIVRAGLVAWSYPQPVSGEPDAVADLDDDTLEWLAREILKLTKPRLFQTGAEAGEERKNA